MEYRDEGYGLQNEFGTDVSLLLRNLKLTPTERWEQNRRVALFMEEMRRAGEAARRGLREAPRGPARGAR
jgi:hypothetical protein